MDNTAGILRFFQWICRFNFGNFEKEEFKKFLRMGVIFALIIGVYWTLRPLKDAVFIQLVGKFQLPFAKTVSVLALLPLVMFYTRLFEKTSREKMLVILPIFYGSRVVSFSFLMLDFRPLQKTIANRSFFFLAATKVVGYRFTLFVESFGSLVIALFWAFATDTTDAGPQKGAFLLWLPLASGRRSFFPIALEGCLID